MGEVLDGVKRIQEASARSEELLAGLVRGIIDGGGGGADIAAAIARHNADTAAHAALFGNKIRRRLTGATTFYVRPDGNDSNDGLANTPDRALKTAAGFANLLRATDLSGRILVGSFLGGYSYGVLDINFGCDGELRIIGEDPNNYPSFDMVLLKNFNTVGLLNNIEVLKRIDVNYNTSCNIGNVIIGRGVSSYADRLFYSMNGSQVFFTGGKVEIYGQPAAVFFVNLDSILGSVWRPANYPITEFIFNNVQVAENVATAAACSFIDFQPAFTSMAGSASGRRFDVRTNSVISTGASGPNFIPGTIAGLVDAAAGGIYI